MKPGQVKGRQAIPPVLLYKVQKVKTKRNNKKRGMTMKIFYSAVLIMAVVALCVTSMPVVASETDDRSGIREKSFEVNPFVGYNFFEKKQNLKDRPIYGGRLGFNLTKHFGIEGAVEFINSRVDDKSRTGIKGGQYRSPMDKVDLTFYHIDAVYHFMPDSKLTPFLVAGLGGAHYSPKISNHDMSTFDLGVGTKYWIVDHIAFRLDLRDNLVTEVFPFQKSYHNIQASAGIVFAFGGKSKSTPASAVKSEPKAEDKVIVLVSEVPEPQIEEKLKVIASEPKTIILAFEDVHFDLDKSTLTEEAQTILKRSVQILKNNPKSEVRIAGYTSASGTEEYNQSLSERRANAVEEYLINEGVVLPDRLSTIGYGETRPAEYEAAPKNLYSKAAKANMRVLFEIIVK
jgi:OOP family OmpA-OmpF porin